MFPINPFVRIDIKGIWFFGLSTAAAAALLASSASETLIVFDFLLFKENAAFACHIEKRGGCGDCPAILQRWC